MPQRCVFILPNTRLTFNFPGAQSLCVIGIGALGPWKHAGTPARPGSDSRTISTSFSLNPASAYECLGAIPSIPPSSQEERIQADAHSRAPPSQQAFMDSLRLNDELIMVSSLRSGYQCPVASVGS